MRHPQLDVRARDRPRRLVRGLSDEQVRTPTRDGWTVWGVLAYLAFSDAGWRTARNWEARSAQASQASTSRGGEANAPPTPSAMTISSDSTGATSAPARRSATLAVAARAAAASQPVRG